MKQKEEAAFQYVQLLDDTGVDLHALTGNDAYLDKCIAEIVGESDDYDEDEMELDY